MFSFTKLAFCVCVLACFVQLYQAVNTTALKFAWKDKSGVHMSTTGPPPKRRSFLHRGRHRARNKPSSLPAPDIVGTLLKHEAQAFCSAFLHIAPFATTTTATATSTTSETLATATTTSTTTVDGGTTTVPTTLTQTTTVTTTDSTTTSACYLLSNVCKLF
jgi:hypothetical protein